MKRTQILDGFHHFCRAVIWGVGLMLAVFMASLNFFFQVSILTGWETPVIQECFGKSLLMLAAGALLVMAVWRLRDRLAGIRIKEKNLFLLLSALYLLAGLYLILNAEGELRADARMVFDSALAFREGDYSAFDQTGYIFRYPHQLGLMTLDRLLIGFSPNVKVFFVLNLGLVLCINYLLYRIADQLFENHWVNVLTILLSFGFLPQLFFILFAYGLIPGLCALLAAFYFTLRFERSQSFRSLGLVVLFCALAVLLKNNFLIGCMAIWLHLFVGWLRDRKLIRITAMILVALCLVLPNRLLVDQYEEKTGTQLSGAPTVLWVAMGTDLDNNERAPGWYDSSVWNLFNDSGFDTEAASALGMEKLKQNFQKIRQNPGAARTFFIEKTITQWCDPLYQSIWSGPLVDMGQEIWTDPLTELYTGGDSYWKMMTYAKTITLAIWILTVVFLLLFAGERTGWEQFVMFFIGGALFHTLWEGKSQYILPYVTVLIPLAAFALYQVCAWDGFGWLREKWGKRQS